MAAPRRNTTLIAVVVILDLGLAGAGAMLLAKGLGSSPAKQGEPAPAPAPTPVQKSSTVEPPAPDTGSAAVVGAAQGSAQAAPIVVPDEPRDTGSAATVVPDKKHHATGKKDPKKKGGTGTDSTSPQDPYGNDIADPPPPPAPDPLAGLRSAVEAKAAQSSGVFNLCRNNNSPAHGTIQIAYQVLPSGHVTHVTTVENSTGSGALAACLENVIAAWTFPPRTGDPANFVRPFKYD